MRTKLLMAIACLLGLCIGFGACVKGNDEDAEVNVSTIVTAFGIDTIYGTYYTFSIDQLNHTIFNEDSLPIGSEDLLDTIAITTFTASGYITSGLLDSVVVVGNDADLTPAINKPGIIFKIISTDGSRTQEYTLQVNVHKTDPEELSWKNIDNLPTVLQSAKSTDQKMLRKGDDLLMLLNKNMLVRGEVSNRLSYTWDTYTMQGLPDDALLHSTLCYQDMLYMITESGDVYNSDDGELWQKNETLSGGVQTLLAAYSNKLLAVRDVEDENLFCLTTAPDEPWTNGEPLENNFPTKRVSSSVFISDTGVERAILVGKTDFITEKTLPWMTIDGDDWAAMSTATDYYCPFFANPTIIYYDDFFYVVGSGLEELYESIGGIVWGKTVGKFQLPESVSGHEYYALTTDDENFIWLLVIGNDGEETQLWRGRLNELN